MSEIREDREPRESREFREPRESREPRGDAQPTGRRVYLGRLPPDVQSRDVEEFFAPIKFTDCRIMGPFGFVEFGDARDADEAVAQYAGKRMLNADIIVEKAKENQRRERREFDRGPPPPRRGGPSSAGRGVRLVIRGLAPDVSWQDLKDFGREGGAVIYADVNRAGEGVLEYGTMGDAENAIDRLSAQTIRGTKVEVALDDSRGPPPPRNYDRPYEGGGGRGGYDRGGDPYGGRGDGRDHRRSPPRRDYGGRYDDRERDRDYRDRSPPRRGGDRDRSPPPRSYRDDRRSPPRESRRGDDRE